MVVTILTVAIVVSGYINNLICAHYSLESARAVLRFNSESIVKGIGQLMMSRNNEAIERLIVEMSKDSKVYRDVRLASHHSGQIVASRFGPRSGPLTREDWACTACHAHADPEAAGTGIVDTVMDSPTEGGDRVLSVMTPILNQPNCRNAGCHVHASGPPILGVLNADYSLARVDATINERRALIAVTVLASLVLGVAASWFTFNRWLARPIGRLIAGADCIAANQRDFRFDQERDDEIGILQASFNRMMDTIESHQEQLRSAKEYLEGIVENSADIIITVDLDGRIRTLNRGAEQALGYGRDELIGAPVDVLFADPRERDIAIDRLNGTDNVKNYETRFLGKDGQVRNVLLTLSRLRDRHGNPIGTFGISKDITQEKQLQRQLVQSKKFAAIGQAVTGIQHAIKNMLGSLTGGAYLVRIGLTKDNRQRIEEGWAMIEEGTRRISELSHNMLNYARDWHPEYQRVDVGELIAKIYQLNHQSAAAQGVTLRWETEDGLPAVWCDPKLIQMATTDLVVNAIDACTWKDYGEDEDPEVVIGCLRDASGTFALIEVRDNGCGMTEEIRKSIFTPFFSTKKNRGTGLGLALTARIIDVHNGKVTVESEPDRGTTFRIHLPIDGSQNSREATDGQTGSLD